MNRSSNSNTSCLFQMVAAICLVGLSPPPLADETEQKILDPGFRPPSEYAPAFLGALDTATVGVLPSIVRRADRTAHSFTSQQQIIASLNEANVVSATAKSSRVDLGRLRRPSQWEVFQSGMLAIAETLTSHKTDADYTLVMEFLVPDNQSVRGIECYILDHRGQNAFSFLLNSHHQMFVDADLVAKNSSEAARAKMIEDATRTGVRALKEQIVRARECAARMATDSKKVDAGILHDFQSELLAGTDNNGIPLGFSTFSDGTSTVRIATTAAHPPRPGEEDGNNVMQLDLNVTGWAGFVKLFENAAIDSWISIDWSAFDEFSFWLYGNNSGTSLFIDVLDNRNPCSTVDDAERYTYEFADDFLGWKLITIPFADLVRKEIGNGAPNDGLGLSNVHGWGFGATNTGGRTTYYIDDFELRGAPSN